MSDWADLGDLLSGEARAERAGVRLIPRGEAIPPCLDAGWVAPDIAGTLDELTDDEAAELQAWLDRGPRIPNVELWRIDDPVAWHRERLVARCLVPSITAVR